ncbi:MAG: hypothetical protein MK082_09555 [Phycisphaerales bacterium]|nr:hypothetical protein [Phycisphaerales bacterium]
MVTLDPGWFEIIEELVAVELERRGSVRRFRSGELGRLRAVLVSRVDDQLEQGLAALLERLVLSELNSITDEDLARLAGEADPPHCEDHRDDGFRAHGSTDWLDDESRSC